MPKCVFNKVEKQPFIWKTFSEAARGQIKVLSWSLFWLVFYSMRYEFPIHVSSNTEVNNMNIVSSFFSHSILVLLKYIVTLAFFKIAFFSSIRTFQKVFAFSDN